MIECRNSTVQDYQCQIIAKTNPKLFEKPEIAFDACLAKELFHLWDMGIKTNGCCCGRHVNCIKNLAYIGVFPEYRSQMLALGYKELNNKNHFKPKTKL